MREKMNAVCLPESYTYNILPGLGVEVEVEHNPYTIPLDVMFSMAARKNKKRRFLFVSQILGKHIPVDPMIPITGGRLLAARFMQEICGKDDIETDALVQKLLHPKTRNTDADFIDPPAFELAQQMLVIGFAETATALGAAFFDSFAGQARYIHTTRERIKDFQPQISFEEEHSHATSHRCYPIDPKFLAGSDPVVLVDDEITTGKTALNIIEELHAHYPRSEYMVVSLLDWRSEADRARFSAMERRLGVRIRCISLISGKIEVQENTTEDVSDSLILDGPIPYSCLSSGIKENSTLDAYNLSFSNRLSLVSTNAAGTEKSVPYVQATGRFGLTSQLSKTTAREIAHAAAFLKKTRSGGRTLCMGTGEFMYLPMQIAAQMGEDVFYQSTTRSPIYPAYRQDYAVRTAYCYPNPEDPAVLHYFYNVEPGMYSEVYFFMERKVDQQRMEALYQVFRSLRIPRLSIVTLSHSGRDEDGDLYPND
ncbi:phosphoribosyltransferase family protein [Aneurinibacillus sp. Ricciae_BoGa-3]|uniref:phosphoribosyltransferase family protein n=1 Tax=Aneurinibacillus sp. Ricciae_BoGa-3 TaxID=3022697 RepID=UPI0023416716|nr:phosphoribosyltransferase family protein [Aneurinibacillus sp. Ricciae_BoGa-3]WCK55582.1 phosphoribosyltransferase family protein [Aneurinibacillus sp. Ricciae_BoGa-3]